MLMRITPTEAIKANAERTSQGLTCWREIITALPSAVA